MEPLRGLVDQQVDGEMNAARVLTLGRLTEELERAEGDTVRFDFGPCEPTTLDSYRGYYRMLAIGWKHGYGCPKADFVALLKSAVGKTFTGYKGGDYRMGPETWMFAAHYGESSDTAIVGVLDTGHVVVIETRYLNS